MTWYHFRETEGFIADGSDSLAALGEVFPVLRAGERIGYDATNGVNVRNRDALLGPKFAGEHFIGNEDGLRRTWIVEKAPGNYIVRIAAGSNAGNALPDIDIVELDDENNVLSVLHNVVDISENNYTLAPIVLDAMGVEHANQADWESNNNSVAVTLSNSATRMGFRFGANVDALYNTHIRAIEITAPQQPPQLTRPNNDYSIQQGQSFTIPAGNAFSDANNDALTFRIVPDISLVSGFSFNTSNGEITVDGALIQLSSPVDYTIYADDSQGGAEAEDTLSIEVILPQFTINSISDSQPITGTQITINYSHADTPPTFSIPTGALNKVSDDGSNAVIEVPDITTHGDGTLNFLNNIEITGTDGSHTDTEIFQVRPLSSYLYGQIVSIDSNSAYANDQNAQIGMWVYAEITGGDVYFDIATGKGMANPSTGGSLRYKIFG